MIKAAWWIAALALLAFGFSGGGVKSPDIPIEYAPSINEEGCSAFALDGAEVPCEVSYTFAERFDAVYLTRFACRTDSECMEAFGVDQDDYQSPIEE